MKTQLRLKSLVSNARWSKMLVDLAKQKTHVFVKKLVSLLARKA